MRTGRQSGGDDRVHHPGTTETKTALGTVDASSFQDYERGSMNAQDQDREWKGPEPAR